MNVTEGNGSHVTKFFSWLDFLVFGIMLCLSALIGVYFAFFAKKKQNTTAEYLMGGKTMGIFPISMSLIASYISGISLLGLPAEMYMYGTQYWMVMCPEAFVSITMALVYLPVFYKLQITSSYEYLNLRFSPAVRLMGSIIFLVKMLLFIPIVIYVPALAFSQVTGINLHLITPIVCVVCIFYTMLGGLKAVVWTDTLQTFIMFGGVIIVMILGTINVGGPGVVWERSQQSDRLEFFKTILILALGILGIVTMSCYTGLVIYATFHDCDPVSTHTIQKADQLLPYFVMQISDSVPGLPGIFLSGVFSAALSSMSTGLNSMTGVIFEDLIRPVVKERISESRASLIMKVIVAVIGTVCVGMVFVVENMGTLVQAAKSMTGITAGSLLGVFSMGMFFPWANAKGALVGGVISMVFVGWISIGSQISIAKGQIKFPTKPVSVEGCDIEFLNNTVKSTAIPGTVNEPLYIYRISYTLYTMIGVATAIIVGLVVSFLTKPNNSEDVDPDLLTPVIHRFLPSKVKHIELQAHKQDIAELQKSPFEHQLKD
ncbi:sodium-coupled monocarboxylate transporter 1 isoform X2 [Cryptotermes secundus]|uniref:sodium-coupled monocarboxylate transporter 1 isoform X2 n=1 Tax=Cryptotermes secundus TaxID=105785 RepID=UPI000CD7CE62|nr:sodium-coupled monocarboxylate transporter 1 isoform X2 [Cryptotermes secundus]